MSVCLSVSMSSPQIRAASEKLTQLSKNAAAANSTSEKASPATVGNGFANSFSSSIPSASEEVLALQKKRFEELKVRQWNDGIISILCTSHSFSSFFLFSLASCFGKECCCRWCRLCSHCYQCTCLDVKATSCQLLHSRR